MNIKGQANIADPVFPTLGVLILIIILSAIEKEFPQYAPIASGLLGAIFLIMCVFIIGIVIFFVLSLLIIFTNISEFFPSVGDKK